MSISFGCTHVRNFAHIFENNSRELTRNSYLNFLRYYKAQHSHYGLKQILRYGSRAWRNLEADDKELFTQKNVLGLRPRRRRVSTYRRPIGDPFRKRRFLNAKRNARRRSCKSKRPPYNAQK
ncbi:uncharacterized protein LOC131994343 isoform X2 [Stomoxys calcitrans]|uniref:uncharacterized protein LOC131994343 isoform X2 n=1 Tax=Stomoxys calcitrans TaxID=35570 RepID=UPI0027E22B83|nr:uncharacterized protein LOC131994343 isoform X2 [Stomoxys calcitrans]